MLSALISGKLIRDPTNRTNGSGKPFTTALVSVPVEARNEHDPTSVLASIIAFGTASEVLATQKAGDSVSVAGVATLNTWTKDGQLHTGLAVTANRVMTAYQRRKTQKAQQSDE